MSRRERRADMADFRHNRHVMTYLIAADDEFSLHREPLLARAVSFWRGGLFDSRYQCIQCEATFPVTGEPQPGLFLFAIPPNAPSRTSVSALCSKCHDDLTAEQIEAACVRLLKRLWPGGKFLDPVRR